MDTINKVNVPDNLLKDCHIPDYIVYLNNKIEELESRILELEKNHIAYLFG